MSTLRFGLSGMFIALIGVAFATGSAQTIEFADSLFVADTLQVLPDARYALAIAFPESAHLAYSGFAYVSSMINWGAHTGAIHIMSKDGTFAQLGGESPDIPRIRFSNAAFGNRLVCTDAGHPGAWTDGVYSISPEGASHLISNLGGGNPNPNWLAFGDGGAFGDWMYLALPDNGSADPRYCNAIVRVDSSGTFGGQLCTHADGPYALALSTGGAFGEHIYFTCYRDFSTIYRVNSAGVVETFVHGTKDFHIIGFARGGAFGTDLYAIVPGDLIVRITPTGDVVEFASNIYGGASAFDPTSGDLYVCSGGNGPILRIHPWEIALADSTTFAAEVFATLPSGRNVTGIALTPAGVPAYPAFMYASDYIDPTQGSGNVYAIFADGTVQLLSGSSFDYLRPLTFGSTSFGSSLFGAEISYPDSYPDGIYSVSPAGVLNAFNLLGGGNPNVGTIVFPGGGPFGDYLYLGSPDSGPGDPLYHSAIVRLDQSGAYAGQLLTHPGGPYRMALSHEDGFGTMLYFTCYNYPGSIYRAYPDGSSELFVQMSGKLGELAFGEGGSFGNDLYVNGPGGGLYRISALGVATLFADNVAGGPVFDPISGDLFLADYFTNQIFRIRDIVTAVPDETPSVATLAILSLAPNPFNTSTEVSYETRLAGSMTMEISDVSGRRVRTIPLGDLVPGPYRARWDGRDAHGVNVSSGVYFMRLHGKGVKSRPVKAILIR